MITPKLHHPLAIADFYILGEIHGVKENITALTTILDFISNFDHQEIGIAFEWRIDELEAAEIQKLVTGEASISDFTVPAFFFASDARVVKDHLDFLHQLPTHYPTCTKLCFFDTHQRNFELEMFEKLHDFKQSVNGPIVVVTGVIHGQILPANYRPTFATLLAKQHIVENIFIEYKTGKVRVNEELFDIKDAASQNDNTRTHYLNNLIIPTANPGTELVEK